MDNTIQDNNSLYKLQLLTIVDRRELYRSYMPFIKDGGLFIPFNEEITPQKIIMGQKILLVLSLLDGKDKVLKDKVPISGKVVWINRGGSYKGFGISLGNNSSMKSLKDLIEQSIIEFTQKKEPTYTL